MAGNHRENLVSLDDYGRTIAFSFADGAGGLAVRNYLSTMTVRPVTTGNQAYVEWCSRFDCNAPDEDKVISQISDGGLVPGLKALEQRFGPAA